MTMNCCDIGTLYFLAISSLFPSNPYLIMVALQGEGMALSKSISDILSDTHN